MPDGQQNTQWSPEPSTPSGPPLTGGPLDPPAASPPPPLPPPPPFPPASTPGTPPPGPGWWIASDGRWYPPAAPSAPSFDQLTPYGQASTLSTGLAGTLQGFFWAAAALSAVTAVVAPIGLGAFNTYWDAPNGTRSEQAALDDMQSFDGLLSGLTDLAAFLALIIFVLVIVWTNKAHSASTTLQPVGRTWDSGWSIGSWFIPVANAVLPKIVLNEIEKIALAPRSHGTIADDWRQRKTIALGWVWWILFVVGSFLAAMGGGLYDDLGGSPDSWRAGYVLLGIGYTALTGSAVTGALYIRRISKSLSRSALGVAAW